MYRDKLFIFRKRGAVRGLVLAGVLLFLSATVALGVKFEGTDGWVFVKERHLGGTFDTEPKALLKKPIGPDEVHLPVSNHHQGNFLECVKTRMPTVAPIEVAVRSDALCQLSDIAMRLGRKLKWDPDKEEFPRDAEANRMLARPMRGPWHL